MTDLSQLNGRQLAATLLAEAGVPADAELKVTTAGVYINVSAEVAYFPDDDDDEGGDLDPSPRLS